MSFTLRVVVFCLAMSLPLICGYLIMKYPNFLSWREKKKRTKEKEIFKH